MTQLPTPSRPPFLAILDEFAFYSPFSRDPLKEQLRGLADVPKATYAVRHGKVFVFDKLVSLAEDAGAFRGGKLDQAAANQLLPQAWVSPEVAVTEFQVMPQPYALVDIEGSVAICHRGFNALLSPRYATRADAAPALVGLLVGDTVAGEGQFQYRGQSMTLMHSFDPATLPPRPTVDVDYSVPSPAHPSAAPYLAGADFLAGLPMLTADTLVGLRLELERWEDTQARAREVVRTGSHRLWANSVLAELTVLRRPDDSVPDYATEESAELDKLYSELALLGSGSLFELYHSYAMSKGLRNWTPYREDEFLFFLLTKLVPEAELKSGLARETGCMAAFSLLQGAGRSDALRFGLECARFNGALRNMVSHADRAMRFLAKDASDAETSTRQGSPVTTLADMFRQSRSVRSTPLVATQHLADFGKDALFSVIGGPDAGTLQ